MLERYILKQNGKIVIVIPATSRLRGRCIEKIQTYERKFPFNDSMVLDVTEYYIPYYIGTLMRYRQMFIHTSLREHQMFIDNAKLLDVLGCTPPKQVDDASMVARSPILPLIRKRIHDRQFQPSPRRSYEPPMILPSDFMDMDK